MNHGEENEANKRAELFLERLNQKYSFERMLENARNRRALQKQCERRLRRKVDWLDIAPSERNEEDDSFPLLGATLSLVSRENEGHTRITWVQGLHGPTPMLVTTIDVPTIYGEDRRMFCIYCRSEYHLSRDCPVRVAIDNNGQWSEAEDDSDSDDFSESDYYYAHVEYYDY